MAELFRSLTAVPEIDLRVHHVLASPPGRPWKVSLTDGYNERKFHLRFGLDWELIRTVVREKDSFFLSASWGDLTNQVCILIAVALGRSYAIFNDAPDRTKKRNPLKAKLRDAFLRFAFGHAKAVLGTGEPALRILEEMGAPREKLINFPYFIDPFLFAVRTFPSAGTRLVTFVSSGRLTPEKAYSDCIDALAQVFAARPKQFRYLVMGTGPELEALKRLAATNGIAEEVEFLGWVDPDESRAVFEQGDVFLHPCQFEPFGVVVAEAMAAGLVVIASDKTYAALDRITHGQNGFLYPTGNIDELSKKIQRVADHPECIEVMGKRARAKAEEWPLTRAHEILKTLIST
jgi:glycosyltransferase involved in cell wall biosynthesis